MIKYFWKSLKKTKIHFLLSGCIGKLLINSEQFIEAIEFYTHALQMCPNNVLLKVGLLHDRAVALSKMGNHQGAIDDCNEALVLCQTNIDVLLLRAKNYDFLGELEMSIQDYELVSRIKNENVEELGIVKIKLKHKLAEERNAKGCEHFNRHDYRTAVTLFTQAIDLWPDNIVFYYNRSEALFRLRDLKQLKQNCMQMLAIEPNLPYGYKTLMTSSLYLSDYDSLEEAIKEYRKFDPFEIDRISIDGFKSLQACEKLALLSFKEKQYLSASMLK